MTRQLLFMVFCGLSYALSSSAQNINGDTIRIYDGSNTSILFPKNIEISDLLFTDKSCYAFRINPANKLNIQPGDKPGTCGLSLTEVKGKKKTIVRQHYFIVKYIPAKPDDGTSLYYDLSDVDKINARIAWLEEAARKPHPAPVKESAKEVIVNKEPQPVNSEHAPGTAGGGANTPAAVEEDTTSIVLDGNITISKSAFQKKAVAKAQQLTNFLKYLCNKSSSREDCKLAIDRASTLFINNGESTIVEVSSKKSGKVNQKKLKPYLNDMSVMRYDRVELSWSNVQYVGALQKDPDGNYRGYVEFEQRFSGFIDGRLIYSDLTRKRMEVVLTTMKTKEAGSEKMTWDVLLSDIGVESTS